MLIVDSLFLKLVEPRGTLNFETPCPMAWGNLEGCYLGGWTSHGCLPNRVAWHPCALQYLLLRTEPWIYTWTVWAYICRGSKYFKVVQLTKFLWTKFWFHHLFFLFHLEDILHKANSLTDRATILENIRASTFCRTHFGIFRSYIWDFKMYIFFFHWEHFQYSICELVRDH